MRNGTKDFYTDYTLKKSYCKPNCGKLKTKLYEKRNYTYQETQNSDFES